MLCAMAFDQSVQRVIRDEEEEKQLYVYIYNRERILKMLKNRRIIYTLSRISM